MKHSVNNKSFDEIFAQRGEQVQPESMVREGVYLLEYKEGLVLHIHRSIHHGKILRYANLLQSGRIYTHERGVLRENGLISCWKATPDQQAYLLSRVSRVEKFVVQYTEKQ